jgi:hypothetical protein
MGAAGVASCPPASLNQLSGHGRDARRRGDGINDAPHWRWSTRVPPTSESDIADNAPRVPMKSGPHDRPATGLSEQRLALSVNEVKLQLSWT